MSSIKTSNRTQTLLESWVLSQFGGEDAKQSISEHAEKIVHASGINLPPVCIVKLARAVGVEPWPVYENGTEGALKIIDGKMRIVLRRTNSSRQTPVAAIRRTRFTYAHELGHALFYDLKSNPPIRLAPTGFHRIEEQLCNRAASQFLMPDFLLKRELSNASELSPQIFRELAQKFQTSIQAIAYRVARNVSETIKPNRFYMLSTNSMGFRGVGFKKPRCVICILGQNLVKRKVSFLQSHQGIDHVKRRLRYQSVAWSLEEYFRKGLDQNSDSKLESEEVVECPNGAVLDLKVRHATMARSGLVWSEGTMEVVNEK